MPPKVSPLVCPAKAGPEGMVFGSGQSSKLRSQSLVMSLLAREPGTMVRDFKLLETYFSQRFSSNSTKWYNDNVSKTPLKAWTLLYASCNRKGKKETQM